MRTEKIGKNTVIFYDSIKEMPIQRHNTMQVFLMQDSGIGSTMQAVEAHFKTLDALLVSGKVEDAIKERQNLHISFYCALEKIDFKSFAFACMIESINGKQVGITEDALKDAIDKLEGLTVGQVDDILEELKKNCIGN
jgi:hypothetical protein